MAKPTQLANKATFIESMECLPVTKLPEGPQWSYEIKLDGYRLEAVKNDSKTTLYSRRRNVLDNNSLLRIRRSDAQRKAVDRASPRGAPSDSHQGLAPQ